MIYLNKLFKLYKKNILNATYYILGANRWILLQFLSATTFPEVARVSAPKTTPLLKIIPQIVVPVFTAFGG